MKSALAGTQHPGITQWLPPRGNLSLSVTHTHRHACVHTALWGGRQRESQGAVESGTASLGRVLVALTRDL